MNIGSMGHVHQSCLSKWVTSKHKDMLNDREFLQINKIGCQYPWQKLPKLKCKIFQFNYKYTLKRRLKIRKSDFTLVFLVLAQTIIFMMDLLYNANDGPAAQCSQTDQCRQNWYEGNFSSEHCQTSTNPFKV